MKTSLNADEAEPTHNAHTIRLRFDDTPEDQALYAALSESSSREHRTPLPRQVKYLLEMAVGMRRPDLFLLKRMGLSPVDLYAHAANAAEASPTISSQRSTTLRLIPGGAEAVKPGDTVRAEFSEQERTVNMAESVVVGDLLKGAPLESLEDIVNDLELALVTVQDVIDRNGDGAPAEDSYIGVNLALYLRHTESTIRKFREILWASDKTKK